MDRKSGPVSQQEQCNYGAMQPVDLVTGLFQGLRKVKRQATLDTFKCRRRQYGMPNTAQMNARSLRRSFTGSESMTVHHLPRASQGTWRCTSDRWIQASSADLSRLAKYEMESMRQPNSPAPKPPMVMPTLFCAPFYSV